MPSGPKNRNRSCRLLVLLTPEEQAELEAFIDSTQETKASTVRLALRELYKRSKK